MHDSVFADPKMCMAAVALFAFLNTSAVLLDRRVLEVKVGRLEAGAGSERLPRTMYGLQSRTDLR